MPSEPTAAQPRKMEYDEGCPVAAAIEAGDFWDGGTCPECGATCVSESCITWVPDNPGGEW